MKRTTKEFLMGWAVAGLLLWGSAYVASTVPTSTPIKRYFPASVDTVTYADLRIVYTVDMDTATNADGQLRYTADLTNAPAGMRGYYLVKPDFDSVMIVTGDTFALSPTDSATAAARAASWGVSDPYTIDLAWHTTPPPAAISGYTLVMSADTIVASWNESADNYQVEGGRNDTFSNADYTDTTATNVNKHVITAEASYWTCVKPFNVGGLGDSRCLNVAYGDTAPAPPPAPSTYANEPVGFDSIMGRPFTTAAEPSGWTGSGMTSSSFSLRDGSTYSPVGADPPGVPSYALSDSMIGEAAYVTSLCAGCGPFTQYFVIPPDSGYTELYVSTWTQISSNFYMPAGSSLRTKTMFIQLCDPSGNNCYAAIYPSFRGSVTSPWNMAFSTQGTAEPGDGAIGFSGGSMIAGQWHQVELYMKLNTVDGADNANPDGLVKMWLDGVLKIDQDSIRYRGSGPSSQVAGSYLFSGRIQWAGTYGGVGSPPENMYVWLAHYYASGGK